VIASQNLPGGLASVAADARSFLAHLAGELQIRHFVVAGLVFAAAGAVARLVNLAMAKSLDRQGRSGTLLPETRTRIHVSRRILIAAVWVVGTGIALGQFPELRILSAGLLASAGVSGLVVGFAARNALGNAVAGVIIAFSQPVRIGDDVEFRSERGIVEDIRLFFTVLRLADGKRLIIPNDVLSAEVLRNLSLGDVTRVARADVLVPPRADAVGLRAALLELARADEGLDSAAPAPEVYWVRIDERGTLLRMVATCRDGASADRLVQKALGMAAEKIFRQPV
jgi:small-conductance mechanosensitive channel